MTQDPRARADSTIGIRSRDEESFASATSLFAEPSKLTQVAQTLAAHGGGALSIDLALDIVLNDVVEQARSSTGATGAAIALFREGELVCRATSGENAPDMGVRVDAHSGLAGACVSTGEIQQCQDTGTDARVNAETCRQLGVRSMLIAPLVDGQRLIGLIQVFSAWPNAFGKREISALQVIAGRIAESNREAETGISTPAMTPELPADPTQTASAEIPPVEVPLGEVPSEPITPATMEESIQPQEESAPLAIESEPRRPFDVWGVVLVVLVIAAALLLGVLLGWRRAAEFTKQSAQATTSKTANPTPVATSTAPAQSASPAEEHGALATTGDPSVKKAPTAPPAGGLLVTQNGKVVYRSSPEPAPGNAKESGAHSLIRKVDPEYPAEAKARGVQGPVVLDVEVLHDGSVGTVAVVSGDPLLAQSAIDAVKQWRYQPEGEGLERRTRVTVNFKLPES